MPSGGRVWRCGGLTLPLDRPLVMGILNVTPDSFSDGGRYTTPDAAIERAEQLVREGADILDIGGCSTRPGAEEVSVEEEKKRIVPVVRRIAGAMRIPLSVDTFRAEVADAALTSGAHIVNDVLPFAGDDAMAEVVARHGAGLVVMHSRGTPRTMDGLTGYTDLAGEVGQTLRDALAFAVERGIPRDAVVIDPGFGFAKTTEQNLCLLRKLKGFARFAPVLAGVSRKRFIGEVCKAAEPSERDPGSFACALWAAQEGASVLRVHDVKGTCQVLRMWEALCLKTSG